VAFSLLLRHLDRSEQITPDGERRGGEGIKKSFSGNCKEKPAVLESATHKERHILSFNNTFGQKYIMDVGRAGTRLRVHTTLHSLWVTPDYTEAEFLNVKFHNFGEVSGYNLESSQT
jgi:hypothetical protein